MKIDEINKIMERDSHMNKIKIGMAIKIGTERAAQGDFIQLINT